MELNQYTALNNTESILTILTYAIRGCIFNDVIITEYIIFLFVHLCNNLRFLILIMFDEDEPVAVIDIVGCVKMLIARSIA